MSDILFRIAAKTDVGLERTNNEDNFQASANLEEYPMKWVNNQQYSLGRKGALLVVADGMGGMNAGEVASEIAINTVRECFGPEHITDEVVRSRYTIEKFMKRVVVEADKRIKAFAHDNPESRGMGTTIVIAWLYDGQLYVSWCGDSRAYIYNPATGLFQITKDHSYVQQLVDAGKISKEDAFDFPDSNIITKSLSDSTPKASPDCLLMPQKLCDNDIILLCSDGLNGMIRDEEIERIIVQNQNNMTECVDVLIKAALDAGGADNCTVALCQILAGGGSSTPNRIPSHVRSTADDRNKPVGRMKWLWTVICLVVFCGLAAIVVGWHLKDRSKIRYIRTEVVPNSVGKASGDTLETEMNDSSKVEKQKQESETEPGGTVTGTIGKNRQKKNAGTQGTGDDNESKDSALTPVNDEKPEKKGGGNSIVNNEGDAKEGVGVEKERDSNIPDTFDE